MKMPQQFSTIYGLFLTRTKTIFDLVAARPIQQCVGFFGRAGFLSLVLLLASAIILFWTWQNEDWRAYVSATAGGLGVMLGASAGLVNEGEKQARWILAIAGGVFTAWFAWYTTADLTHEIQAKAEIADQFAGRLQLAKSDLIDYLRPLPQDEIRGVLTEAGDKLRSRFNGAIKRSPPFRSSSFDSSRDVIDTIIALSNNNNGHVQYFLGEIERKLGDPDRGHQRFYAYLEAEGNRTRNGVIGAAACRNADGFCRERTAWIFHLMANDFYAYGKELKAKHRPEHEYRAIFLTALKYTCSAITLFPKDGFSDPGQTIATRGIERFLADELREGCRASAEPP